jgi:pyrroline-5-carboxylate reductase
MQGPPTPYYSPQITDNFAFLPDPGRNDSYFKSSTTANAETDRAIILRIFSSIGRCRFLDEKHFDACTALSGSGPAFACIFLEAMADGGVMMGLPRPEALELAAQSASLFLLNSRQLTRIVALQGAARMVLQGGTHPAQLKDSVTSKHYFLRFKDFADEGFI